MPELSRAPQDVVAFVRKVAEDYCPDLVEHGVTVGVLMAMATDKELESGDEPPFLKDKGYPCDAYVEKNSTKLRLKGTADATVVIDDGRWRELDEDEMVALIHHELHHLELSFDEDGRVELDKANRPVLNMRLHDIVIGGFRQIIEVHGAKALEAQQLRNIFDAYKQRLFAFADDQAEQDPMPDVAGAIGR